jgi:hypothetical protein
VQSIGTINCNGVCEILTLYLCKVCIELLHELAGQVGTAVLGLDGRRLEGSIGNMRLHHIQNHNIEILGAASLNS